MKRHFLGLSIIIILTSFFSFKTIHNYSVDRDPDSLNYVKLKNQIKIQADSIRRICRNGSNKMASDFLFQTYTNRILPSWYGTKWEFYGKSKYPKTGSIACGYFVINTLCDLDLNLQDPIGMAENYSAYIISTLCDSTYKFKKPKDLIEMVKKHQDDVWVVGLSNHSGLLVKSKGRIFFIHSSPYPPSCVVKEIAETSAIFQSSKIFVAGHLFYNNTLSNKWVTKENIPFSKKW